jgi:hypothetical protein
MPPSPEAGAANAASMSAEIRPIGLVSLPIDPPVAGRWVRYQIGSVTGSNSYDYSLAEMKIYGAAAPLLAARIPVVSATASSYDELTRADPMHAFDGRYDDFWHVNGSDTFPKWVQADLGSPQTISRAVTFNYGGYAIFEEGNKAVDFQIWVGDDPSFAPGSYIVAASVGGNDAWVTQQGFPPVTGRYVRYVVTRVKGTDPTHYWNSNLYELELWNVRNGPTLTAVAPTSGSILGGVEVTLTGTFMAAHEYTVTFGDVLAEVTSVTATNIEAVTRRCAAVGPVDVSVTDRDGRTSTLAAAFTCTKVEQSIAFEPIADRTFGDLDLVLSATASSDLPVTYGAAGSCTVTGDTVHVTGPGRCTITASQRGDSLYEAALPVVRSFRAIVSWSKLLAPIDTARSSAAKAGSALPLKFQLTGASGAMGAALEGKGSLSVYKITDGKLATVPEPITSTSSASQGAFFRYDAAVKQYVYNLRTTASWRGPYAIVVDLGDGVAQALAVVSFSK